LTSWLGRAEMELPREGKSMKKNKIAKTKLTKREAVDWLLTQLPTMDREALLKLWQDLFGRMPGPDLYRTTLIPILAYRIQESA